MNAHVISDLNRPFYSYKLDGIAYQTPSDNPLQLMKEHGDEYDVIPLQVYDYNYLVLWDVSEFETNPPVRVGTKEDTPPTTIKWLIHDITSEHKNGVTTVKFIHPITKEVVHEFNIRDGKDGRDGHDGIDGLDGKDGLDGLDGKDGLDGLDGKSVTAKVVDNKDGTYTLTVINSDGTKTEIIIKDGADGKDGIDGLDGKDGLDGRDGKDGRDGADGRDGKDGRGGKDCKPTTVETVNNKENITTNNDDEDGEEKDDETTAPEPTTNKPLTTEKTPKAPVKEITKTGPVLKVGAGTGNNISEKAEEKVQVKGESKVAVESGGGQLVTQSVGSGAVQSTDSGDVQSTDSEQSKLPPTGEVSLGVGLGLTTLVVGVGLVTPKRRREDE